MQQQMDQVNELSDKYKAAEERMLKNESYFFETFSGLRHSMDAFTEECRKSFPEQTLSSEQAQRIQHMRDTLLEPFYTEFTDTFRGSRAEIKERLEVYLPYVSSCAVDWQQHGILDLGCGRGEWVELLTESGYAVKGLDTSGQFVALCKASNLPVEQHDALEYLQQASRSSVGAITAFHLIEHFELDQLMAFFDRAYRALVPGGMLIVETPNPQNLLVGSCNFWFDPTHVRPLPPKLIEFLSAHIGFEGISILPLHPANESEKIDDGTAAAQRINQYFYGDQDYAVIAYKRQDSGY
jgi:O-antigen chain-terminating methyltransferase